MKNAIRTMGSVVIKPEIGQNIFGECIELYKCKIPEGSNAFSLNVSDCISFAALEEGDLKYPLGRKYNRIPKGAKEIYIPDLKNKKDIYFI